MYNRKVQPIYEALDARNPKQAVKLCDAALKKASIPLVRALKAVALERIGRADEATALVREEAAAIVKAPPIDETVLSTLMIVFRAVGLASEGSAAYEAAWQVEPDNSELAAHLFSSHLRTAQYAKAQAVAMKMFKRPQGDEYIFWAVSCVVLQVDDMAPPRQPHKAYAEAAPPEAAAKHLQLAAAMLGRAATQGKLTRLPHLQLYDEVLKRQQAHAERLTLLDTHGALEQNQVESLRKRAELHERLGQLGAAQAAHATLLREHTPDAWISHTAHLRCALARVAAGAAEGEASDAALDEAAALLRTLQSEQPKLRGPWLAEVVLHLHRCDAAAAKVLLGAAPGSPEATAACGVAASVLAATAAAATPTIGAGTPSAEVEALLSSLRGYFGRYGDRPVCVLDTAPCLRALAASAPAQEALLGPLMAEVGPAAVEAMTTTGEGGLTLSTLRPYMALCQWRVSCGATSRLSLEERSRLASSWLRVYMCAKPLSAALDSRERGHADVLVLIAAQVSRALPWPPVAFRGLPWPSVAFRGLPWPSTTSR